MDDCKKHFLYILNLFRIALLSYIVGQYRHGQINNLLLIYKSTMERCPSGLRCKPGTFVWGQLHRGFESRPLRIKKTTSSEVGFLMLMSDENPTKRSFVYGFGASEQRLKKGNDEFSF